MSSPFRYSISLSIYIDGREYEFGLEWQSPVQLRTGDTVYIDGLEDVDVEQVSWKLDDPGSAFVRLADQHCEGPPSDWKQLERQLGESVPLL